MILRKLMISCFEFERSRTTSSALALEDLLLDPLELVADLAEHREAVVERVVDDLVEQVAGALREAAFSRTSSEERQRSNRYSTGGSGWFGSVIRKSGPMNMSSSAAFSRPTRLVEDREVQDDEEVVVVLVDLRALVAREDVLVVERVELEVLLEPGALGGAGALDVDPAQAAPLDDLDLGLGASEACGIDPCAG